MGRAFTDEEKQVIKRNIVKEAKWLFRDKPYKDVKVSEIAHTLGIAKGSFYNFFESKEALLLTILAEFELEIHEKILSLMVTEVDKKQFLTKVMLYMVNECRSNQLFQSVLNKDLLKGMASNVSQEQRNQLYSADEELLLKLVGNDLKLKLPIKTAIDMLRSIFFLQSIGEVVEGDINKFNYHMIRAVVNEVFE